MRVAFLGRGRLGMQVLDGLLQNPHLEVPVIFTCGATPEVGLQEDEFARVAAARGIDFYQTNNINKPEWIEVLRRYEADVAVALLWLHTVNRGAIETTRHGFINCHAGLLPKYRGNAVLNWAILNRESEIGLTVHFMAAGDLDSGPVIKQERIPVGERTTVGDLFRQVDERGARLVLEAVEAVRRGELKASPQEQAEASYCYPRLPRDGELDWNRPARELERLVRATTDPYPGAYSYFTDVRDKHKIKKMIVWEAHVEAHPLREFYAVPGHLLKLEKGAKWGVACGDNRLLILDRIEIGGVPVLPAEFFRTVRQRFGLDVQTLAAELDARLRRCEAALGERERLSAVARLGEQFLTGGADQIEQLTSAVSRSIERATAVLRGEGLHVEANPLRNYSFQKRFYDWERRERWFGVQVYESFRLLKGDGEELVSIGLWYFSDVQQEVEQRVYLSLAREYAAAHSGRCREVFERTFGAAERIVGLPPDPALASSWYVSLSGLSPEEATERMIQLAKDAWAALNAASGAVRGA